MNYINRLEHADNLIKDKIHLIHLGLLKNFNYKGIFIWDLNDHRVIEEPGLEGTLKFI